VADALAWLALVLGVAIGLWSIDAFVVHAKLNELDVIDLLLGMVVAGTVVAVGLRLSTKKSPWGPVLLGGIASLALCVLALLKAAQDFNGPH
jgi:hypothetical protein